MLKTAFSTRPGFYAASTRPHDDLVPAGQMRFFVARIEAYDGGITNDPLADQTEFKLLVAMADGKPEIARALLQLHGALAANLKFLKEEAKQ